jgi:hypothetical protein
MAETTPTTHFDPGLDVADLPVSVITGLWQRTVAAHENLFGLWRQAAAERFGEPLVSEIAEQVAPQLASGATLREVFFDDLNTMIEVVKEMPQLLTVARDCDEVLPAPVTSDLDPETLSPRGRALLWNVSALAYMFVTNRWYEAVAVQAGDTVARLLEKEVWLDRGGAEDDLRIGLDAARASGGDVETLLKGFQLAPGEVGLVDVDFDLKSPSHGWLTHKRCPAWDRFGNENPGRREHSCVICVVGMRLSGEMIDPRIRCRPASLPPHREPGDHVCKWEYWLDAE